MSLLNDGGEGCFSDHSPEIKHERIPFISNVMCDFYILIYLVGLIFLTI